METARVVVGARCRLIALLVSLAGLLLEFESSQLLLWPLDHSCARSPNATSLYAGMELPDGPAEPALSMDALQRNLFDASVEDPFTLARAISMDINYEDIERCFEYPLEGPRAGRPATLDMESLEPCRHGLHFEEAEPSLSIVGHFELGCARQWMKLLVGEALVLGLLLGSLGLWLALYHARRAPPEDDHERRGELLLLRSMGVMLFVCLATQLLAHSLDHLDEAYENEDTKWPARRPDRDFYALLACILARSALTGALVARLLIVWAPSGDSMKPVLDRRAFLGFGWILVASKILYLPTVARLFDHWHQLNSWLTFCSLVTLVAIGGVELAYAPELWRRLLQCCRLERTASDQWSKALTKSTTGWQPIVRTGAASARSSGDEEDEEEDEADDKEVETTQLSSNGAGVVATSPSEPRRPAAHEPLRAPMCQFCLVKEEHIFATTRAANQRPNTTSPMSELRPHLQIHAHEDAYAPTSVPVERATPPSRQSSRLELDLFRRSSVCELVLIVHLLAFNYFILQTLPNHKLLHSESVNTMADRKMTERRLFAGAQANGSSSHWPDDEQLGRRLQGSPLAESNAKSLGEAMPAYQLTSIPVAAPVGGIATNVPGAGGGASQAGANQTPVATASTDPRHHYELVAGPSYAGSPRESTSRAPQWRWLFDQSKAAATMSNSSRSTMTSTSSSSSSATPTTLASVARVSKAPRDNIVGGDKQAAPLLAAPALLSPASHKSESPREAEHAHKFIFDYKRLDYATETLDSLRHSANPLELLWLTSSLNGWPIELAVLLIVSDRLCWWRRLTSAANFSLNHLLSVQKHCTLFLAAEWLLVALARQRNHLIELEWLAAAVLISARVASTVALGLHLDTMLRLAELLRSARLLAAGPHLLAGLAALALGQLAPQLERANLAIIPLALVACNLLARYLAARADDRFQRLLCPLMFRPGDLQNHHHHRRHRGHDESANQ